MNGIESIRSKLFPGLKRFLKSILSDIRQAFVGVVVGVLIVSGGGVLYLYKATRDATIAILSAPAPLWATISLVFLGCLYTFLKLRKVSYPSESSHSTKYITVDNLIWKIVRRNDNTYYVDEMPICKRHKLPFLSDGAYYRCPEADNGNCVNEFKSPSGFILVSKRAESYIAREMLLQSRAGR